MSRKIKRLKFKKSLKNFKTLLMKEKLMVKEFFKVKSISKQMKIVASRIRIVCLAMPQNLPATAIFPPSVIAGIQRFNKLRDASQTRNKDFITQ